MTGSSSDSKYWDKYTGNKKYYDRLAKCMKDNNDFYKTNLKYNYYILELKKQGFNDNEPIEQIKGADLNFLRAILTGYIRQERFIDGLWVDTGRS